MKKLLLLLVSLLFSAVALAAVNLNTATKEELDAVKGIGPVKAQAIVDYRKEHGPFKSVDDLKNVKGFGDKTVDSMRKDLTVSGANTGPSSAPAKSDSKPAAKEDKKPEPKAEAKKEEPKAAAKEEKKADAKAAKEEKKADAKKEDKKADAKKDDAKKDDGKKSKKDEKKDDAKKSKKDEKKEDAKK